MKRSLLLLLPATGLSIAWMATSFEKDVLAKFTAHVYAIPHEKLYMHTDKSVYVTGEKVWFRAYLVNARDHAPGGVYSRFIYADLVDQRDSLVARVKVAGRGDTACFHGYLPLPRSLPQGNYCLRGYSYYMQNDGDDFLFKKQIRVINPRDSRVRTEVAYRAGQAGNHVMAVRFLDVSGAPYSRAFLTHEARADGREPRVKTTRADENGEVIIRVDTAVKHVKFGFLDGKPFSFTRHLYLPRLNRDADVQFFPEGGTLLVGNWQNVAFKAVGTDGMPVNVEGELYQDSTLIATFASRHDGMGVFRVPVSPGHRFSVVTRLPSGEERHHDLPVPSPVGFGLTVKTSGDSLLYRVLKGEQALFPGDLYLFVHSAGRVMALERVNRLYTGKMALAPFPEGIAHLLLVDGQGAVYSERLLFVRQRERPRVKIVPDRSAYATRDRVTLDIGFEPALEGTERGSFSITVTDDSQVPVDTTGDHILSHLLLTSELKGHIHAPAYYFSGAPGADEALDLVMMTHGWRRFDFPAIMRGEIARPYPIERGQVVSGKVDNLWGKRSKAANVILLSTSGIVRMGETDDAGHFSIDVAFPDSTRFVLQALSEKGRRGVAVTIDKDAFLPPRYTLPRTLEARREEEAFFRAHGQNYYYEQGEKIYLLDEVTVTRRRQREYRSFYDRQARYYADSAAIAEVRGASVPGIIQQLFPGVLLERDDEGEEYFSYFDRRLYLLANDFEERMEFFHALHPDALLSISMLDGQQGRMYFGEQGAGGVINVSYKFGFTPASPGRPNIVPFTLLGYQKADQFYVPKYDIDSVRTARGHDSRRTIYWNPVVNLSPGKRGEQLSFYTADTPGRYSVLLEGITAGGRICRERHALIVKTRR
ncbi:MAG: hypothetical protein LBP56_02680 [Odoribacteraceae bacterium]|nr:hypothetical protein [Odoribacteraceae bacterium]